MMKKALAILLTLSLVVSLTACGEKPSNPPDAPDKNSHDTGSDIPPTVSVIPPESGDIVLSGSSYWVLEQSGGVQEGDNLWTDLTLWEDGTARIREIEDGYWLVSDIDEQNMTWTAAADGTLHLYTQHSGLEPYWTGIIEQDGTLELERFGGTYRFKEEPMPEGGMLYAPAELQGVWLQVSSEIEGCTEDALPGNFNSLVFRAEQVGDEHTLLVSAESGDYSGAVAGDSYYGRGITLLDQPIFEGCGNNEWSVRIGEESPLSADGYPLEMEIYVTLLDQNTLLRQCYFSYDNGTIPVVSYQTYKRFLPMVSRDLEQAALEGGDFKLVDFTAADGTKQEAPDGVSDFYLHLDMHSVHNFTVTFENGEQFSGDGRWIFGEGGTLLLFNVDSEGAWMYDESVECDWFAGAAQNYDAAPELYLWYKGGVMRLEYVEGSGDENYGGDGYVDTMNDFEGAAFAAPEDALLVLYSDQYAGENLYDPEGLIEQHYVSEAPGSRRILIAAVLDDTRVWVEEDGVVTAEIGTLYAGEYLIIQIDIPDSSGPLLHFEVNGTDYQYELTSETVNLIDGWSYIIPA